MTDQLALFASAPKVGARSPDTSRAAALEVAPRTGTQRWRVLQFVTACGDDGATDDEIQDALAMSGNTERPRRLELVEGGWIIDSGTRRRHQGRDRIVWIRRSE